MQLPRKMSAHNVMASITRTLRTKNDAKWAASNAVRLAGEESKEKLYEPKHKQKLVRVLTVVAYVISVSLAAIILSLYYMLLWDPKDKHYTALKPVKSNASGFKVECLNVKIVPAPPIEAPSTYRQPEVKTDVTTIENDATTQRSTRLGDDFSLRKDDLLSTDSEDEETGTTSTTPEIPIYPEESARDIMKNRK